MALAPPAVGKPAAAHDEREELLAEGASEAEVAEKLALKPNTLHKAIRAGRVRSPVKKNRRQAPR